MDSGTLNYSHLLESNDDNSHQVSSGLYATETDFVVAVCSSQLIGLQNKSPCGLLIKMQIIF